VKIRLTDTRDECEQWVTRLRRTSGVEVVEVSGWYPGRGTTVAGRVYLDARPTPDPGPTPDQGTESGPPCPAGGCLLAGPHGDLVLDALEYLNLAAPSRRREVEAALRALGDWHDHDGEDDCPPQCPAAPARSVAGQENQS
jgi:hypothetical protein